jgi:hypothetical protein
MPLARVLSVVVAVAATLAPVTGVGQGEPVKTATLVAVLPPDFSAQVSEGARATLLARFVEGLKAARFDVLAGDDLTARLGSAAPATSCRTPDCYPPLAQRLRVAYLVRATVTQVERSYDIALVLVRGRSGEVAAELSERCDICGIEEVGEKMALAASALRAKLEALMVGPARLTVRTNPPGAYVYLDGNEIGRAPLEREVPGGSHTIRVSQRGYLVGERTVMLVPEIAETVELALLRAESTFPYRTVGWTALGTGLLAIGGGILAVLLDGREIGCRLEAQDAAGHCPYVRSTRALGAVLTGVGAAATTAGGLLLWIGSDRGGEQKPPPGGLPTVTPVPGGAAVSWGRRF